MSPTLPPSKVDDRFTYEVLLPYSGERVLVQGQGDAQEELLMTP
jgi:hypothetical protein